MRNTFLKKYSWKMSRIVGTFQTQNCGHWLIGLTMHLDRKVVVFSQLSNSKSLRFHDLLNRLHGIFVLV